MATRSKKNGAHAAETTGDELSPEALRAENARLREQLAKATAGASNGKIDKPGVQTDALTILRGNVALMPVRLRGSALMVHRWGQKAIIEMLSKMTGADMPQLPKDLTKEYEDAAYKNLRAEHIIPCRVIHACMVAGASTSQGAVKASEIKQRVTVLQHTAPIRGHVEMDVRPVKVGPWNDKVVDLRARPLYTDWYTDIVLRFQSDTVSKDKVLIALRQAGSEIGLCEFRKAQGGDLGHFEVEALPITDVDRIIEECSSPEEKFVIPPELLRAATAYADSKTDKRNGAKKAVGLIGVVNGAEDRFAAAEAANGAPLGVAVREALEAAVQNGAE
jgi:hypothetical protein